MRHDPVLLAEVVRALAPQAGDLIVDGTFGGGGYAQAILAAADCRVLGVDRDPDAIARGAELAARFPGRLGLFLGNYSELAAGLASIGASDCAGIVLDLGLSSFQLDDPDRGFSFLRDGPLDMRMERAGPCAADIVNTWDERRLADAIYLYGEERHARRIARAIVADRSDTPFTTTGALARLVESVKGGRRGDPTHPATQTFQALRIVVNGELDHLNMVLIAAEHALAPGGRLVVVSFHSLEDRAVKSFLTARCGLQPETSRHLPAAGPARAPSFALLTRKPVIPGPEEVAANPRARSAKLRAARRTAAPAWPDELPSGGADVRGLQSHSPAGRRPPGMRRPVSPS